MATAPNLRKALESWSAEILARAGRIRDLIGDAHWLSDGMHKEELFRDFLSRQLPSGLAISRGFVVNYDAEPNCSPELDILVTAPSVCPPLLNESGLRIVLAESALGHIEVKSTFSSATLADALRNSQQAAELILRSTAERSYWRALAFTNVEASRTLASWSETITEVVRREGTSFPDRLNRCIRSSPLCIASLDRFVSFLTPDATGRSLRLKSFSAGSLSFACAVADLITYLGEKATETRGPNFTGLIQSVLTGESAVTDIRLA